jgi:predicted aspartyl protease
MRFRSMQIPVSVRASYNMADVKALVDSGATDNFIHLNFVKRMGIGQRELDKPKNIYNIDDTTNKAGQITHYLNLTVTTGGKSKEMRFLITDIGQEDVLLGYPWLLTYEPHFSWKHGTIDESNLPIVL